MALGRHMETWKPDVLNMGSLGQTELLILFSGEPKIGYQPTHIFSHH